MFIFVILSLFSAWQWVDATEEISMGLSFKPYHAIESYGASSPDEDIVFVDLDLDGDQDILRCNVPGAPLLEAFENVSTPTGRSWRETPSLINGIDLSQYDSAYYPTSLGAADINDDGRDEIIISAGKPDYAFVNKGEPGAPYWVSDQSLFFGAWTSEPDFADIDGDGDFDMVGHGPVLWWNLGTPQRPSWKKDLAYFNNNEGSLWGEQSTWIDWDDDGVWDLLFCKQIGNADPPPNPWGYILLHNTGSPINPKWEYESVDLGGGGFPASCFSFLDWNKDGTEDILIQGADYDGGYLYHQGKRTSTGLSFRTFPTLTWGGIMGTYPSVADLNANNCPEIVISEQELHYGLGSWYIIYYYYPHFRYYTSVYNQGPRWQCYNEKAYRYEREGYKADGALQYIDFGNNGLMDYIINITIDNWESEYEGFQLLYRNQGTRTDPDWVLDTAALSDIPPLFPSCFLDIDGDRDKDVIGYSIVDSTIKGFLNVRSDNDPSYMEYELLVSGLEGIKPTYIAAGDITDNELDLPDLAIGIIDGELTAYFNSGQDNPRWHKHEEVFKGLGVNGNPCLCDADADSDLDLYLVTAGRLHYYRNESTGGISDENSPARSPGVTIVYIGGHELEISLTSGKPSDLARLLLYNAIGQRVMQDSRQLQEGMVRFRILQPPGVYFYQVSAGGQNFKGKIVLY